MKRCSMPIEIFDEKRHEVDEYFIALQLEAIKATPTLGADPRIPGNIRMQRIYHDCSEPVPEGVSSLLHPDQLTRVSVGQPCELVHDTLDQGQSGSHSDDLGLSVWDICLLEWKPAAIASSLATVLAVLHWGAYTDASEVSFMIGSEAPAGVCLDWRDMRVPGSTSVETGSITRPKKCPDHKERMYLWCTGLAGAHHVTVDREGVNAMVEAHVRNNASYPQPGENLPWLSFRIRYLLVADNIIWARRHAKGRANVYDQNLPDYFITAVEDMAGYVLGRTERRFKLGEVLPGNYENRRPREPLVVRRGRFRAQENIPPSIVR